MKQMLLLSVLLIAKESISQLKEGTVQYEVTRNIPGISSEQKISLQEQYTLVFTAAASLYEQAPVASTGMQEGAEFKVQSLSSTITYCDLNSKTKIQYREIYGKEFLVRSSINPLHWQITQTTKKLLNYTAVKAISQRVDTSKRSVMENGEIKTMDIVDTVRVEAWFVPDIPISTGPAEYSGQLPGLILEVNESNGAYQYKAIEISAKAKGVKPPSKGKVVTNDQFREEFKKITDEALKNRQMEKRIRQ
jgi:GLPGLI family protein